MPVAKVVSMVGFTLAGLVPVLSLYYVLYWRNQPKSIARRILRHVDNGTRAKETNGKSCVVLTESELRNLKLKPEEVTEDCKVTCERLMEIAGRS